MTIVDVQFPLRGIEIAADHGYSLFSIISEIIPELHGDSDVGIFPISGTPCKGRTLALTGTSSLTIRIDSSRIEQLLPLAGQDLNLEGHEVHVGLPTIRNLIPAARLYSRLVTIKGYMEPDVFLEAVQRQLDEIEVKGMPFLVEQQSIVKANEQSKSGTHSPVLRRTLRIKEKEVVGFAVRVEQLTAEESMALQEKGVGGRRRFGCGIFLPDYRG